VVLCEEFHLGEAGFALHRAPLRGIFDRRGPASGIYAAPRQARKTRTDAMGALQHLIGRGINRQELLSDKTDYKDF
jgi:hypothetical protein